LYRKYRIHVLKKEVLLAEGLRERERERERERDREREREIEREREREHTWISPK
jgi:hypothetical protein